MVYICFIPKTKRTYIYKQYHENNILPVLKALQSKLHLDDRVEQFNQRQAFVTLKDHKENFRNNPKCRLLNPAKSEIGIISKHYIEKINSNIRKTTNMNQWQNTQAVITWFKSIENKRSSSFIKFDIDNFYPSITKELLTKSIRYAKSITTIEE